MQFLRLNPMASEAASGPAIQSEDPGAVDRAIRCLRQGGLVIFPTETVYGIGADGLQAASVNRIFEAKRRPLGHPLILHVSGLPMARALAAHWTETAQRLAEAYWPGPLTLVLPASPLVPMEVRGGGPTVALRMPAHRTALAIIRGLDRPVAAPSANRHQGVSPTTAQHAADELGNAADLILDGGPCEQGLESTVVDLSGGQPRILRPGPISSRMLRGWASLAEDRPANGGPRLSPGLSPRHYAPHMPLRVCDEPEADAARLRAAGLRVARLARAPVDGLRQEGDRWELPCSALGFSRGLYAALHAIQASEPDCLVVDAPPEGPAWEAVRDRLRRAAHPASTSTSEPSHL